MKVSYAARETGANLRRNLTLTLASILTIAVSLTLSGVGWNFYKGVNQAFDKWRSGVQFIVFMKPDATDEQIEAVRAALDPEVNAEVESVRYVDSDEAFAEVQRIFGSNSILAETFRSPDDVPTSFRVAPITKDADLIKQLGAQFSGRAGVQTVTFNSEAVKRFQRFTSFLILVFIIVAIASLVSAGLLIVNTIRLAIFARRREIEVMKLVGATNWFIRVPFMLEGLIQGLVGALLAWAGSYSLNEVLKDSLAKGVDPNGPADTLQLLTLQAGPVRATGLTLVLIGALLGAVGSGVAVSRFLDV